MNEVEVLIDVAASLEAIRVELIWLQIELAVCMVVLIGVVAWDAYECGKHSSGEG